MGAVHHARGRPRTHLSVDLRPALSQRCHGRPHRGLAMEVTPMEVSYEKQTVDNPNPLARFAHRTRLKKSKRLLAPLLTDSAVLLDYGCGQGRFLHDIATDIEEKRPNVVLLGYDPYQSAQFD